MQRNKLIYALADAALVVSADLGKGGTWAGAEEQLDKLKFTRVYVRSTGELGAGLETLQKKGALPWLNPGSPEELREVLRAAVVERGGPPQQKSLLDACEDRPAPPQTAKSPRHAEKPNGPTPPPTEESGPSAAQELFDTVRQLLARMNGPKTEAKIADELGVQKVQVRKWLERLVKEGRLEKLSRPVRYRSTATPGSLFDRRE
jgi:predicted Rossmann fold nucleotide-binding protein DprA/Smf involved in DNA uptake